MATDWTPRTRALAYYEKLQKIAMRGDDDYEHLEQAVNALRRSQDHTAIQARLSAAVKAMNLAIRYLEADSTPLSNDFVVAELRAAMGKSAVTTKGE